jgi:cytochrome c556
MKQFTPSCTVGRILASVVVLFALGCSGASREPATATPDATLDKRTAVALPADGQQAVLDEMRQMLGAMGGAMSAAAQGDTTALLAALLPAGSAAAADPAIEELLPAEWKELAERTHGAFDSLAVAVRRTRSPQALKDTVLVRLAQISGSCTACHDTYRVTVK